MFSCSVSCIYKNYNPHPNATFKPSSFPAKQIGEAAMLGASQFPTDDALTHLEPPRRTWFCGWGRSPAGRCTGRPCRRRGPPGGGRPWGLGPSAAAQTRSPLWKDKFVFSHFGESGLSHSPKYRVLSTLHLLPMQRSDVQQMEKHDIGSTSPKWNTKH